MAASPLSKLTTTSCPKFDTQFNILKGTIRLTINVKAASLNYAIQCLVMMLKVTN